MQHTADLDRGRTALYVDNTRRKPCARRFLVELESTKNQGGGGIRAMGLPLLSCPIPGRIAESEQQPRTRSVIFFRWILTIRERTPYGNFKT